MSKTSMRSADRAKAVAHAQQRAGVDALECSDMATLATRWARSFGTDRSRSPRVSMARALLCSRPMPRPMRTRTLVVALTLAGLAALLCPARSVLAQETKEVTGNVVMLDSGDVVIDIGKKQGAVDGDVLELWRPLKVK